MSYGGRGPRRHQWPGTCKSHYAPLLTEGPWWARAAGWSARRCSEILAGISGEEGFQTHEGTALSCSGEESYAAHPHPSGEGLPESRTRPREKNRLLTAAQVQMGLKPLLSWTFQFLEPKTLQFCWGQFVLDPYYSQPHEFWQSSPGRNAFPWDDGMQSCSNTSRLLAYTDFFSFLSLMTSVFLGICHFFHVVIFKHEVEVLHNILLFFRVLFTSQPLGISIPCYGFRIHCVKLCLFKQFSGFFLLPRFRWIRVFLFLIQILFYFVCMSLC